MFRSFAEEGEILPLASQLTLFLLTVTSGYNVANSKHMKQARSRRMTKYLTVTMAIAIGLLIDASAFSAERLCGWMTANTKYPDWTQNYDMSLRDSIGTHDIYYDGGKVPDLSSFKVNKGEYIRDHGIEGLYYEGWMAHFCACLDAIEEDEGRHISKFNNLRLQPLNKCRNDPGIAYMEPLK